MQSNINLLSSWLSTSFGHAPVSYQYVDMLHKFRVETAPMRWLYVSAEFMSDQPEADLLDAVIDFEVLQRLRAKPGPTHLLLTHTGVVEVNADFGRSTSG